MYQKGEYYDIDELEKLRWIIPRDKNILEIGGHCGTQTLFYAQLLMNTNVHVFEPQKKMFDILSHNINQNGLQDKVKLYNGACFCCNDDLQMSNITMDGVNTNQDIEEIEKKSKLINYGGICLGTKGEKVRSYKLDDLDLENIGFIHCDAQGSENFLFYGAQELIKKYRPIILYENKDICGSYLYNAVCVSHPQFQKESAFDIKHFCMNELNYSSFIHKFNCNCSSFNCEHFNTLLIP